MDTRDILFPILLKKNLDFEVDKPSPVIIHVFNLPFNKAVNALAVGPVCELPYHPKPVGPLLSGKQFLNWNRNPLSSLLGPIDTHHFLL